MSKIKELPYKEGAAAFRAGKGTKENPYWEGFEQGMEWAFHEWLNGWSDEHAFKIIKERNERSGS